jgi:hypothetical protein
VTFWESKKEHRLGVVFRSVGGTLRCCLIFVCMASKDTGEAWIPCHDSSAARRFARLRSTHVDIWRNCMSLYV